MRRSKKHKKRKPVWIKREEIEERFKILNQIYKLNKKYQKKARHSLSVRGFESAYGECYFAKKLLDKKLGNVLLNISNIDVDILIGKIKIEVKTTSWKQRYRPKGKTGFGWPIKPEQCKPGYFRYLVCIGLPKKLNKDPQIMVFKHSEVMKYFTKCDFLWKGETKELKKNYRRLDIIGNNKNEGIGNIDLFNKNNAIAKEVIKWKGKIKPFERKLNENTEQFYQDFGFDNFIKMLKGAKRRNLIKKM